MKYNFCTLFDSYYLTRGIALHNSLKACYDDFHLYIFAFDEACYNFLKKINLDNATIISSLDFEDADLLRVKPTRTIAEYCWTCTASTIWYSINKFNLDHCTYLDADMLFFSSPKPIFEEIGSKSVGLSLHNFASNLKYTEVYGKYCVQFVFFRNDKDGLGALNWWREKCIEWCYAKMEDGKLGDQKYLDYFQEKFNNVCEIRHPGAGVAPWNISKFSLNSVNGQLLIALKEKTSKNHPLIFYHFQGLKFRDLDTKIIAEASCLKISEKGLKLIYEPYISQLIAIRNQIKEIPNPTRPVIFRRKLNTCINTFFRIHLKRFIFVRKLYYLFQKERQNRPKKMGGTL